jgi:hypothetical protein
VVDCFQMLCIQGRSHARSAISRRVGRQWPLCRLEVRINDMFPWLHSCCVVFAVVEMKSRLAIAGC